MIYHFGYVLYEHGDVIFILSVCKGRLKLYYYKCRVCSHKVFADESKELPLKSFNWEDFEKCRVCSHKDFAEESKELPLKSFNWEDFENNNYPHSRRHTQMSFVFFGVKKDVEGKEDNSQFENQTNESDEDIEVAFLIDKIIVHKVSEHNSSVKFSGVNYKELCFNYSRADNCCGIFYNDEWQNRYFSDVELSWCKLHCINSEENSLKMEITNVYKTIHKTPQIVENTDIEHILSHLYVKYENGSICRPGNDDWEYNKKITTLDINADPWLIDFLEVGEKDTERSRWNSIVDYRSSCKELKGDELNVYRANILRKYSKKEHLVGLLREQTSSIEKSISTLKLLNESRINELLKYGDIKKNKFLGHHEIIDIFVSHKDDYISLIEATVRNINQFTPPFGI